ncbi:nitroreductase [Sporolactobacillus sp. KGMB 08714]|uniref:nitroreductase n=1 Tax=Sporolactobacillus sp. KGMB 08714 TaxID=3064704 RepID=UPI002FBEDBBF
MNNLFDQRKTVRKYTDQQVPKDVLLNILSKAQRAPSWGNSQPWEVYVAAGESLERLRKAYLAAYDHKEETDDRDMPKPKKWPDNLQNRMSESIAKVFADSGIIRDDRQAREKNWRNNFSFFNAPVAVFLCLERELTEWSTLDAGIYAGHLMLAATYYGLGSTPAASSVSYPHILREILKIPDHQRVIVGIMMGYEDADHPYNRPVSIRVPVSEAIHFRGI